MTPTNRTDEVRAGRLQVRELLRNFEKHFKQYGEKFDHNNCERCAIYVCQTLDLFDALGASAITSAVEAERERCAKVAEHQATICGSSMSRQTTAHDIAFNIRQTPTQEGI